MLRLARKFIVYTTGAGAVGFGGFLFLTRKSQFVPYDLDADPLFNSDLFKKFNPNANFPALHDLCVRRVPLSKIRPELLKEEGKLVEAFCGGIYGGIGYEVQRKVLENKYRGPETASQLWDKPELAQSAYAVGTQITDHFEVVSHTPTAIVVRAGDSPRKPEVRESDGLFEMSAVVKEDEGVAEFRLKSLFFRSAGNSEERLPPPVAFLHRLYTQLWMETGIKKALK
ncbi:hypothetical protein FB45DRAFT_799963 [Roridomyces roridus]|uniref:Uncharacterized protein n=1 Tax=Roridomyces roridus TaxID=1738132 RepID=A0AAD7FGY1_9AGAR|nr:hypothetical protein FB45DRAFT_799963 [Roridomyces roridus]